MRNTCPGLNDLLRPKPTFIKCPNCENDVEIWTDEDKAECLECGAKVSRNMHSCLDWCEHAEKCENIVRDKNTE